MFTLFALSLWGAAAGLYLLRSRHETPPAGLYVLAFLVGAVGAWLGEHGGGVAAVAFLVAGAFLLLHMASEPYREKQDRNS